MIWALSLTVINGTEYEFQMLNVDEEHSLIPPRQAGSTFYNCPDDFIIVNVIQWGEQRGLFPELPSHWFKSRSLGAADQECGGRKRVPTYKKNFVLRGGTILVFLQFLEIYECPSYNTVFDQINSIQGGLNIEKKSKYIIIID